MDRKGPGIINPCNPFEGMEPRPTFAEALRQEAPPMTANRAEQKGGGSMGLGERLRALAERFMGVEPEDREYLPFQEIEQELRALAAEVDGYVMVPVEVGAPVIRLVEALRQFTCGDWLIQHGHRALMCDSTDKLAFEEAAFTYGDILALAAALKR